MILFVQHQLRQLKSCPVLHVLIFVRAAIETVVLVREMEFDMISGIKANIGDSEEVETAERYPHCFIDARYVSP